LGFLFSKTLWSSEDLREGRKKEMNIMNALGRTDYSTYEKKPGKQCR
jgi:hypothetical protein